MTLQRCLLGLLSFLFAASLGAFLLYVPMLPGIIVAMILMGLAFMFALGFMTRRPSLRMLRRFGNKDSGSPSWRNLLPNDSPRA